MKAMIWKEWRENLTWAAVAFFMALLTISRIDFFSMSANAAARAENLSEGLFPISLILAPLTALWLGSRQISGELRRDQWAFLMHRPVSRTVIFTGKVVAGLSMYLLALVMPLVLIGLFVALQKNVPMSLVFSDLKIAVSDVLKPVIFYFVGMLIVIRRTRWYGSRFLPVFAALFTLIGAAAVDTSWQAVAILSIFFVLSGLAVWGAVLTDNHYPRMPRAAKIGLGSVSYLGLLVVITLAGAALVAPQAISALSMMEPSPGKTAAPSKPGKTKSNTSQRTNSTADETTTDVEILKQNWSDWGDMAPWFYKPLRTVMTPPLAAVVAIVQDDPKANSGETAAHQESPLLFAVSTLPAGLLFGLAAFLAAKRARLTDFETYAWSAGAFFLGLSGFLLLLSLREWPLLEECPKCGRKRSIRNELCEHCGTPTANSRPDATAIFEHNLSEPSPLLHL